MVLWNCLAKPHVLNDVPTVDTSPPPIFGLRPTGKIVMLLFPSFSLISAYCRWSITFGYHGYLMTPSLGLRPICYHIATILLLILILILILILRAPPLGFFYYFQTSCFDVWWLFGIFVSQRYYGENIVIGVTKGTRSRYYDAYSLIYCFRRDLRNSFTNNIILTEKVRWVSIVTIQCPLPIILSLITLFVSELDQNLVLVNLQWFVH